MGQKFQNWQQMEDQQKAKDDIDSLIMLTRLCRFYAKVIGESYIVQGSLKADVAFIHSSCNSFLSRFRSGIKDDSRAAFDKHLNKHFEPWGTILQGLTYLNNNQTEAVERFVVGICNGIINARVESGTMLVIDDKKIDE